jgi:uncharacterized protein (DUF2164 family)
MKIKEMTAEEILLKAANDLDGRCLQLYNKMDELKREVHTVVEKAQADLTVQYVEKVLGQDFQNQILKVIDGAIKEYHRKAFEVITNGLRREIEKAETAGDREKLISVLLEELRQRQSGEIEQC